MQISLDTSTASTGELTAIIALLASLGGRLPASSTVTVDLTADPSKLRDAVEQAARPAPPPPAPAPDAPVAAAAPPPPANEEEGDGAPADPTTLDADGIPWDARIHAGTKTQNKDGTWKKLRGVSEVLYGEVHAELQEKYAGNRGTGTTTTGAESQATGIAGAPAAPNPPSSTPAAPPPPGAETGNAPLPPATESAPTAAASPAPAPAESASGAGRFPDFPSFVQGVNAIRQPNIPYLELNGYAQTLGIAGGFKDMKDRPDLWETFYGLAGGQ